jgi:hypothetical protein
MKESDKYEYIEKILREKQEVNKRRYESFKQRLSMAIAVLTLIITLILFIMKDYLVNILFLFDYVKCEPLASISLLLIVFLLIILIFYNLFRVILLLFKALEPINLEIIDYESFNIMINGELDKGRKTFFRDLKDSNDANEKQLNDKYTDVNQMFIYLLKSLIFITVIILIIFFLTLIEQVFIK